MSKSFLRGKVYKPFNPNKPMVKRDEKLILVVKESKAGQKRVTIPKHSKIEEDDYVEVKKIKFNNEKGGKREE